MQKIILPHKKTEKWATHDNKPIRIQKSHPYKKISETHVFLVYNGIGQKWTLKRGFHYGYYTTNFTF
jgi:hypothetical protein